MFNFDDLGNLPDGRSRRAAAASMTGSRFQTAYAARSSAGKRTASASAPGLRSRAPQGRGAFLRRSLSDQGAGIRARIQGSGVRQAAGGYAYPEIPQEVEQGIPDYYGASRAKRGLPPVPPEAGILARKIGRYVAQLPNDPDNRGSIEGTIAQVLVAASQEAASQGDEANASLLAGIAAQWAAKVRQGGMTAPDPDAPLPMAGFDFGADPAVPAPKRLPMGYPRKNVLGVAFTLGVLYGASTSKSRDDAAKYGRGIVFGAASAAGSLLLLRVLGYSD